MAEEITDDDPATVRAVRDDLRAGLRAIIIQGDGHADLVVRKVAATQSGTDLVVSEASLTTVAWELDYTALHLAALGLDPAPEHDDQQEPIAVSGVLSGVTIHDERTGLFHRYIDWFSLLQQAGVLAVARPQKAVEGAALDSEADRATSFPVRSGQARDSVETPAAAS